MFVLYADKTNLDCRIREPLTSGSVNVYEVHFQFSDDWEGLTQTAVFKSGGELRSVVLGEDGACRIPWEVLEKPGMRLSAGVYGTKGSTEPDQVQALDPPAAQSVVLPTVWADLGYIFTGAAPGEDAKPPTPELWRQELAGRGNALAYNGLELSLMSGDKRLSTVPIAGGGGEGIVYQFGHGLRQDGLKVSIETVDDFSGDNTLPMTAAGVKTSIGNIEALLGTI